jgi:glycosyltransferase involved in cell wall biosynthesis
VRACAHAADAVIATDTSLRPVVLAHLGVDERRVTTIPNAIDLGAVDRLAGPADGVAIRHAHGVPPERFLLVSTGRLEQNKGFHVLVAALAQAAARLGDWQWVLVGDGPWRDRLRATAERAGLGSRIIMPGRLDDARLHAWYEAADVFVHPTLYEGSSLVTLEAMAHRRAIVATRAGGLPDKVRPGENGWLVPPADAHALSEALVDAAAQRDTLPRLGERSRHLVESDFAWPAVAAATEALYRRLLAPDGAREAPGRRGRPAETS